MTHADRKQYYYYPLTTKDFTFESIFASESISPCTFYQKRGYGSEFCYLIPKMHHKDALILYNEPPEYETGTKVSVVKFYLKLEQSALTENDLLVVDEGVFAYPGTVYLNSENFSILFFTLKEKAVTTLKAETSLTTKGLKKYENNIQVVPEKFQQKKFATESIDQLEIDNTVIQRAIRLDQRFNFLKGFIYGIAAGLAGAKSEEEIRLKRALQEIVNGFAELKNRSENRSYLATRQAKSISATGGHQQISEEKIKYYINEAAGLFSKQFPGKAFSEESLIDMLMVKLKDRLPNREEAQRFVNYLALADELFESNYYEKLKRSYYKQSSDQNPNHYFDLIELQVNQFVSSNRNGQLRLAEQSFDHYKLYLNSIHKYLDVHYLSKASDRQIELSAIEYNAKTDALSIKDSFQELSPGNLEEFTFISNIILKNSKLGRGDSSKEAILRLVDEVGSSFGSKRDGKSTQLYQYLSNSITEYSLTAATSAVMKNFVAFVFNPDSSEKLENYLDTKLVEHSWMAYSFWGAYNGFTSISRNLAKPIFESSNRNLQRNLDHFLADLYFKVHDSSYLQAEELNTDLKVSESVAPSVVSNGTAEDREYYEKFIDGKLKIPFDDFIAIITQESRVQILQALKDKYRIGKKKAEGILDSYKEFKESPTLF